MEVYVYKYIYTQINIYTHNKYMYSQYKYIYIQYKYI